MRKLRHVVLVLTCAALASPSAGWAADVPPPGTGKDQSAELQQLKAQLDQQQQQIEALRTALEAQQKLLERVQSPAPAEPEHRMPNLGEVASITPIIPRGVAPVAAAAMPQRPLPQAAPAEQASPLQIHIGDATITPVGFMDITNTFRSTNAGSSLQTNFGSFPYNNIPQGRLTEDKWSAENSRIGFRVDAKVKGANVLGYFEGDFVGLGNASNNTQVNSNSMLFACLRYLRTSSTRK
jgi:hypothetical protein